MCSNLFQDSTVLRPSNGARDPQGWIKHWFPEFEFTWLGEEMRENLPKEMDFVHEKVNAERAMADFENVRTSMYIREHTFLWL